MTKAIAYFKHGQALTKLECEAHGISISDREPLYNRKTLLEVCHAMAVAMSPQLANGVAVSYDYERIVDKVIEE